MSNKDPIALKSFQAIRDKVPATRLALDLYEIGGMRNSIETYQRRVRACFDPDRAEVFQWWEAVAMMKLSGVHDPFLYLCDVLGYQRPEPADSVSRADMLKRKIEEAELQLREMQDELERLPVKGSGSARLVRFYRGG